VRSVRSAKPVPRILSAALLAVAVLAAAGTASAAATAGSSGSGTATPIKHLVVIFQENVSFDHYFATYPNAANLSGERPFHAAAGTPTVNGLSQELLTDNPNAANPQRLGDDCSTRDQVRLSGRNVGDLLNDEQVTWGWFEGGFAPTTAFNPTTGSKAVCGASHPVGAALGYTGQASTKGDYIRY